MSRWNGPYPSRDSTPSQGSPDLQQPDSVSWRKILKKPDLHKLPDPRAEDPRNRDYDGDEAN